MDWLNPVQFQNTPYLVSLGSVAFFLLALWLLARARIRMFGQNSPAFHKVSGGVFVLALGSLFRAFVSMDVFSPVGWWEWYMVPDIAYWIMTLAGIALILRGTADRRNEARMKKSVADNSAAQEENLGSTVAQTTDMSIPQIPTAKNEEGASSDPHNYDLSGSEARRRLSEVFANVLQSSERLTIMFTEIKRLVSADFAALSIHSGPLRFIRRYSKGPSGRFLLQSGLSFPRATGLLAPAFHDHREVILGNLSRGLQPDPREFIVSSTVKSIVAIPFRVTPTQSAVLMLASEAAHAYGKPELEFLRELAPFIARLVVEDGQLPAHPLRQSEPETIRKRIIPLGSDGLKSEVIDREPSLT